MTREDIIEEGLLKVEIKVFGSTTTSMSESDSLDLLLPPIIAMMITMKIVTMMRALWIYQCLYRLELFLNDH